MIGAGACLEFRIVSVAKPVALFKILFSLFSKKKNYNVVIKIFRINEARALEFFFFHRTAPGFTYTEH